MRRSERAASRSALLLEAVAGSGVLPFDARTEVQVITPSTRGVVGTRALNEALRQRLNPGEAAAFRVGDRVMQVSNNYNKLVFNGEVGVVVACTDTTLTVDFGNGRAPLEYLHPLESSTDLQLAWAITVHKAQGCEFPCVVVPMFTAHYPLLSRNLYYTAVTRATKLAVVVADAKAVAIAVRTSRGGERHTALERLLTG
ncbi:hypothetical protein CDCA_CDCA18G4478 [Cyanidium caldarium]|uniref:Uncharacterized protein n=1 Tax=Cyanidium caldarium TaxID=2771 RepID=A0AAV9J1H6_CYACA|nr:hypothetical protein CDCA_CDCA18G4478 [Cyanidium caldarium]